MNTRPLTLSRQIAKLISEVKHIPKSRLMPSTNLYRSLNFDIKDVVDVILVLEQHYQIYIPDEVPVETVGDLIRFVGNTAPDMQAAA
jgi:acyl carrier protein